MAFLLDTCAVSEYSERTPNPNVINFLEGLDPAETFISSITMGEIRKGIELRPVGTKRRTILETWFQSDFLARYGGQVLPFDAVAAEYWGVLVARLSRAGFSMAHSDSLIAAIALAENLVLVTRNQADFAHCGVQIVNPWK
jgi:toxin FitB